MAAAARFRRLADPAGQGQLIRPGACSSATPTTGGPRCTGPVCLLTASRPRSAIPAASSCCALSGRQGWHRSPMLSCCQCCNWPPRTSRSTVVRPAKAIVLDQDLAGGDCWLCRVAGHWAWFCVIGGHPDTPTWLAGCPLAGGDGRLAVVMPYAGSCGGADSIRVVQRG